MNDSIFGSIPIDQVKKAKFDLTHDVKLTGNMGKLMPVLCEPTLPGESWNWNGNLFIRFAPLLFPVMHRVKATFHAYFVANRTLNTNWKLTITGGQDGEYNTPSSYVHADEALTYLHTAGESTWNERVGVSSLWSYLGLPAIPWNPAGVYVDDTRINILPFLAYKQIWQYYYKDQNVDTNQDMIEPIAGSDMGGTTFINTYTALLNRAWNKDPFTSALPWPQRGQSVLLPVTGTAEADAITYLANSEVYDSATNAPIAAGAVLGSPGGVGAQLQAGSAVPMVIGADARIENIESVTFANNTITINDFRTAIVVQKWLEISARGGSRYNESILSHFDTVVPDYLIDQPHYIGGSTQMVQFSEVLTTANSLDADDNVIPPASMAGHGVSIGGSNSFTYTPKEHGWIIVILSVMPETSYQQGLPRKFTTIDRLDYAWPSFVGLGEQEVLSKEIYYDPTQPNTANDEVFGYQQRYWEYKSIPNRTVGEFQTTLKDWTMTRIFATRPDPVDTAFIYSEPTTRIFAVEDTSDKLWMQVVHKLSVLRPLPYYSVPGVLKI